MRCWTWICILIATSLQLSIDGIYEIKIGVHFNQQPSGNLIYSAFARAAQLNNISDLIHPQAKLSLTFLNSADSQLATVKAGFLFIESKMLAVFGAGVSALSGIMSKVLLNANIPQWYPSLTSCCASSSPALSNKTQYPNFFRTIPNDEYQGRAIVLFAVKKGWKRISILCLIL